jgi:hypothetical protein
MTSATTATAPRERPILFSGAMIRAILDGTKSQTRRVVTSLNGHGFGRITEFGASDTPGYDFHFRNTQMLWNDLRTSDVLRGCPYGAPGDHLWCRETWALDPNAHPDEAGALYRATDPGWDDSESGLLWRPSIFMPRWASRITLEVTEVRVERLQTITEADAIAEGVDSVSGADVPRNATMCRRDDYAQLWDTINAKRGYGWDSSPYVWVVSFRRCEP